MSTQKSLDPTFTTPIAIVGLSALFAKAANLAEFWDNIVKKIDGITDVPLSRWDLADYYDADPSQPDKTYCKRGGFIPEVAFDPMEFGLPPNILEVTDVSQLLALMVCKDALADAGYAAASEAVRQRTGVILGVGGGQKLVTPLTSRLQYPVWQKVLRSLGLSEEMVEAAIERMKLAYVPWEENSFPGLLGNVISGRVANRLDLGGINCVVDAACASSLSALQMAASELAAGRADMMLTGGVDADNSIFMYMSFSKTPAFSRKNEIKPFDADSDGMLIGEGMGILVLKRLADAERDGDRIYAVIKGLGASSDGRYKSIYAPRSDGQALALRRAYASAGFEPATVGLIEAHGTGTVAGDLCEVTTLNLVFSENNPQRRAIALGSVKSQIGHTKAAAGAASLVKTALALHHKVLPPTLNIQQPNAQLDNENTPFYLNTEARPWVRAEYPRRAGVSSFGFGGTNFHVVLEEYQPEQSQSYRLHRQAQTLLFHAATPEALRTHLLQFQEQLQTPEAERVYQAAAAESSRTVPAGEARLAFVAETLAEARELLALAIEQLHSRAAEAEWQHPKGVFYRRQAFAGKVAALFPGQGAQHVEMGRELLLNFPLLRETFHKVDALFRAGGQTPLSSVVYPPTLPGKEAQAAQAAALQRTDYAQPAIGALSAGLYQLFQAAGLQADFAAGHSFGELTALWAAGVMDEPTYFQLMKARGASMAPPAQPGFDAGAMLAVTCSQAQIQAELPTLPGVHLANWNAHNQVVVAGATPAIESAEGQLQARGYSVTRLPVAAAFHTPLVGHAQQPFARVIQAAAFHSPNIPVYANASAQPYPHAPQAIQEQLAQQLLQPVLFAQQIENLYQAGATIFIEFGPRNILTNLVKNVLANRPHLAIALNVGKQKDSDRSLREAAAQMRVAGLQFGEIDRWAAAPKAAEAKPKSALSIQLNGANYVSEKTRKAFETALSQPGPALPEPMGTSEPMSTPEPAAAPVVVAVAAPAPVAAPAAAAPAVAPELLAQLMQQQAEVTRMHEQYLQQHNAYVQACLKLLGGETPVAPAAASQPLPVAPVLPAAAPIPPAPVVAAPAAVAPIIASAPVAIAPPAPVILTTIPAPTLVAEPALQATGYSLPATNPATDLTAVTSALMEVVSEKTGYPMETLDASMDMESDLGIDSIKRVEILGAMQTRFAELPRLKPEELAELRTLGQIIEHIGAKLGASAPVAAAPVVPAAAIAVPVTVVTAPAAISAPVAEPTQQNTGYSLPATAPSTDLTAVTSALMEVVSEKTGYPAETLDASMDMESDLGIDSIKRVEILGAMQTRFAELPRLKPEELAELRTLGQIIEHIGAKLGASAPVVAAPVAPAAVSAPVTIAPVPVAEPAQQATGYSLPATAPATDLTAVTSALMEVVSEKTGYPAETLDASMDMESDLGIDSIKRVEILGAMQTRFAELPRLKPEELAELRTLGQIIEHIGAKLGAVAPAPVIASEPVAVSAPVTIAPVPVAELAPQATGYRLPATGIDLAAVTKALMEVVSEKTGYPAETLDAGMDMESDLGIDSIKRVEILGAMQTRFAELPRLKPEELAELRTLGQIIEHIGAKLGAATPAVSAAAAPAPAEELPDYLSLNPEIKRMERGVVRLKPLPPPDLLETQPPAGAIALVTNDGTPLTVRLVEALATRGWQVVVVNFPQVLNNALQALPKNITQIALPDWSESNLAQSLKAIRAQYGNIGAFIHLNPQIKAATELPFAETEKAIVKHVFLMAKHLEESLTAAARAGQAYFMTVARLDGEFGLGSGTFGAIGGGLFGLTKTLNREWQQVYCRALDLMPHLDADKAVQYILAELQDPNRLLAEVAYGLRGRATLVAEHE